MTPAERLKAAATYVRDQIEELTTDQGEWWPIGGGIAADTWTYGTLLLHPVAGSAIADWLDSEYNLIKVHPDKTDPVTAIRALAVADALLGEADQ